MCSCAQYSLCVVTRIHFANKKMGCVLHILPGLTVQEHSFNIDPPNENKIHNPPHVDN